MDFLFKHSINSIYFVLLILAAAAVCILIYHKLTLIKRDLLSQVQELETKIAVLEKERLEKNLPLKKESGPQSSTQQKFPRKNNALRELMKWEG